MTHRQYWVISLLQISVDQWASEALLSYDSDMLLTASYM